MLAGFWSLICEDRSINQEGLARPGCSCRAPPGSRCHLVSQVLLKPLQPLKVQICFLLLCRLVSDSFSLESRDAQSYDLSPLTLLFWSIISLFYRASQNMWAYERNMQCIWVVHLYCYCTCTQIQIYMQWLIKFCMQWLNRSSRDGLSWDCWKLRCYRREGKQLN